MQVDGGAGGCGVDSGAGEGVVVVEVVIGVMQVGMEGWWCW